MEPILQIIIPVIAVVVVAAGIFITNAGKYFTIREHQAYMEAVKREFDITNKRMDDRMDVFRDAMRDLQERARVLENGKKL